MTRTPLLSVLKTQKKACKLLLQTFIFKLLDSYFDTFTSKDISNKSSIDFSLITSANFVDLY